ncbi:hypothetical protein V6N11_012129 [Hibiscus sabdariffa]|uniref:FAD/NAD(P)-binding domain-containing protein n=1 Tax=Hibiscus sabdariffa TaxID=183260 RepID=A0ABR2QAN0_9ROSI
MAAIVETYEANTKMMKQNNKILQEILKQVKLVSKRLGIEDEGEISDAGKIEAKQDGPEATIHHVFDQLSTPNEGDVGDQTIQNYEGLQIREKLIIASSNDIGVTENHVKDDRYPVFGSDMLVQLDGDLKILSLRKHRLSFVLFSAVVWLLGYAVREFAQHGVQPGDLAIIFKETVTLYGHPTQSKAYIFLKGVISLPSFHVRVAGDEENLFLEWYKEKGIRLILSIKIVKANVPIKTLVSTSAETFKCQILIIATGSTIVRLIDFDGQRAEAKNNFYLGEIDDADKLVEANKAKKNGKADIVGEGYTELELGAASHTPLECALQTHPNITVIGEDVVAKKLSLKNLDYVSVCLPNASCRGHFTQQASLLLFMLDTKVESLKGFSRLNLEDKVLFSGGASTFRIHLHTKLAIFALIDLLQRESNCLELQKDPSAGGKSAVKKRLPKKIRQIPDCYFLPRMSVPSAIAFYGACIAGGIGAGMLLEVWINKKIKEDGGVIWEFDK